MQIIFEIEHICDINIWFIWNSLLQESDLNNSYTSSVYKVLNIPREVYQLVDYLNRNGMNTPNLFTVERKYATSPLINDIRDWLNFWSPTDFRKFVWPIWLKSWAIYWCNDFGSKFVAGNPYTAAEALLMLLESPPEPLASPIEEECLYAESFDKCCEIVKILSGPKKNTFLYVCMFLIELLTHSQQNRLDAVKLGEFSSVFSFLLKSNCFQREN